MARATSTTPAGKSSGKKAEAGARLAGGFRWTRQRCEVYELLQQTKDHPTASELFMRAKEHVPGISLATIYNCLETLTQAGLVKQVNLERSPSRYCANLQDHAHFYDEESGQVMDIALREDVDLRELFQLPPGVTISGAEISLKGRLPVEASSSGGES